MPKFLLKDGRTVNGLEILDFDATHTLFVSALSPDEFQQFVAATIPDPPPPPPPPVTQVTPRQARLALDKVGLLDKVNQIIAGADKATQITWEFASVIDRHDPLIEQLGGALGLVPIQIDGLFETASKL